MVTRESLKWPVQKARGAILETPGDRTPGEMCALARNSGADATNNIARGNGAPRAAGPSSSLFYSIAIFVKHAFEGIGKNEAHGLSRALPVRIERLVAAVEPPIRLLIVIFQHQRPGFLAFAEQDLLAHIAGQEPVDVLVRDAADHGLERGRVRRA